MYVRHAHPAHCANVCRGQPPGSVPSQCDIRNPLGFTLCDMPLASCRTQACEARHCHWLPVNILCCDISKLACKQPEGAAWLEPRQGEGRGIMTGMAVY